MQIVCIHRKLDRLREVLIGRDYLFKGRSVLLPPSHYSISCLQVSGVRAIQRNDACDSHEARGGTYWCRSDLIPSTSIIFASRGIVLIHSFACFHMSDLHDMLAFMFNQIKFKYFTCLPPRDPVQQEKHVFPSSGIRARFRLRIACIKASSI